jgi:cation diffusion facilitator CzcD-associated flavoprotein CzcO
MIVVMVATVAYHRTMSNATAVAHPSGEVRHCIVGAGPSGLSTLRAMLNLGLKVDAFERHDSLGGIWNRGNPGTPMYESAHFISSRDLSGYTGYPMPKDFPDYPRHDQVLSYLRSFAEEFGLIEHIHFSTSVNSAAWDGSAWVVTTSDGATRRYRTLTCANGTQWHPFTADFPGVESFTGATMHSRDYNEGPQLAGKRVLVIGAGNSGVDIACDAARFAKFAAISVRRGYHLVPKHILGKPADVFATTGPHMPVKVAQVVFPLLLKATMGDPTKHGWPKPDHKILESHPIVNDQILHHLRHGDLEVRRNIERFDGAHVVFTDGKREQFDLVIFATGYTTKVPYLDAKLFVWKGNRPKLFLRLFSPTQDGLACMGFTEGDGGAYELFDNMSDMIARTAHAAEKDPVLYARLRKRYAGSDVDLSGGTKYLNTDRHSAYVNLHAWQKVQKDIRKEFGWPPMESTMFDHLRREVGPIDGS